MYGSFMCVWKCEKEMYVCVFISVGRRGCVSRTDGHSVELFPLSLSLLRSLLGTHIFFLSPLQESYLCPPPSLFTCFNHYITESP